MDHWHQETHWRTVWLTPVLPALMQVEQHDQTLEVNLYVSTDCHLPSTLSAKLERMLCVKHDLSPFYALAQPTQPMYRIIESLYGVHHLQNESIFEALCMVIIEQQISLYVALKAQHALVQWGGHTLEYDGRLFGVFPHAGQIAQADVNQLQSVLKITHRRTQLIVTLAQQITNGELDLEAWHDEPTPILYERLIGLKGVGHWTAAWVLLRGYGRHEIGGYNDVALRDAVAHYFYGITERCTVETVQDTFKAFQPFSGLAAFYTLSAWALERY
ncbi:MAG: DNA-3-methyladenine glycosylase family protein [Phototrophicaceae bacterium]